MYYWQSRIYSPLPLVSFIYPIVYFLLISAAFTVSFWHNAVRDVYFCRMKFVISLSLLLGTAVPACAQFNTVSCNRPLYKVESIGNGSDMSSLHDDRKPDMEKNPARAGKTAEVDDADKELRGEWIRRYLSVSYPLSDISVSSRFGTRTDPFTGRKARHNGLDLKAHFEEVYSIMEGIVVKVSADKRSGRYVTVRYGDYTVSYCHLSRPLVKAGCRVMPGEVIAVSGNTGRSTGPHLHLTVRHGRRNINPEILLRFVHETRAEALAHLCSANS